MSSSEADILTPEFEAVVENCVKEAIEQDRETFDTKLETFEGHAEKLREQITQGLHEFRRSYVTGYRVLLDEVKKSLPEDADLTPYIAKTDNMASCFDGGEMLYSTFGYTQEVLQTFYDVAYPLFTQNRIQDAYDAYFFLVMIAPSVREYWLNFGYGCLLLGKEEYALDAYYKAFELDPTKADSYLASAGAFLRLNQQDNALGICDVGLHYAEENSQEPWADELTRELVEGKTFIAEGGSI